MHDDTETRRGARTNPRTRRRTNIVLLATIAGAVICGVGAIIASTNPWWIISMIGFGAIVGFAVGMLIPAAIEDGEVNAAEHRASGHRTGRAHRVGDDGPTAG
jgi:hypothetical protein